MSIEWKQDIKGGVSLCTPEASNISDANEILDALAKVYPESLGTGIEGSAGWVEFSRTAFKGSKFPELQASFAKVDDHLRLHTFMVSHEVSLADIALWSALRAIPIWMKNFKDGSKAIGPEISRWFGYVSDQEIVQEALNTQQAEFTKTKEKKKDQGSFEIDLEGAEMGKVVTRFPPEPSGYLHIGHAKAVLLNQYFAHKYQGKLIIRFDDTNPSKEKDEYEKSIMEDLEMLGVKGDVLTYTSDHFQTLYDFALRMIKEGKAYADDTPLEQMREERFAGTHSKHREDSVEDNLRAFEEMTKGSEEGLKYCLRAKISMENPNKALRDPVIYRCNLTPHHRVGDKWKVYPTYDFACPIVDSIEGVTHALRTDEYHDRNPQYYWMVDALGLRKPFIWDYSRLNFIYTLLSKRKLNWFVNEGKVSGWDDPRFPTVRGIIRRGMTVEALREYILMQGASKNATMLEWDKIWAVNKKVIDPIAPRYVALSKDNLCKVVLTNGPSEPYTSKVALHKKNPEVGEKDTAFSSSVFIEQEDAKSLAEGEEATFMDWGNIIVEAKQTCDSGNVIQIKARLNPGGDFKKTKKITWLSPDPNPLISIVLHDFDYLITKKKLEEGDELQNFITPVTEFIETAIGDANLKSLRKGAIIQLERKGFYIVDREHTDELPLKLIAVPDGRAKSISSKSDSQTNSK